MSEESETPLDGWLLALVACNGRARKAERLLKARGVHHVDASQLHRMKVEHQARYEQLRAEHAPDLEKRLASGLRDTSMLASEAMQEAVKKAIDRLEAGEDPDPAKTAANLATVQDKSTRTMLTLEQRPTSITENRNVNELIRTLAATGIIELPAESAELEQGGPNE